MWRTILLKSPNLNIVSSLQLKATRLGLDLNFLWTKFWFTKCLGGWTRIYCQWRKSEFRSELQSVKKLIQGNKQFWEIGWKQQKNEWGGKYRHKWSSFYFLEYSTNYVIWLMVMECDMVVKGVFMIAKKINKPYCY